MKKILAGLLFVVSFAVFGQASDSQTPSSSPAHNAWNYVWTGAGWDRQRLVNTFKNVSAVVITSETTVWTPASGKKFRLMGYCLTQGVVTGAITLKDNTAGTTILIIPPHTIAVSTCSSFANGILSAAANNVLTATGASTETITGYFFGVEE